MTDDPWQFAVMIRRKVTRNILKTKVTVYIITCHLLPYCSNEWDAVTARHYKIMKQAKPTQYTWDKAGGIWLAMASDGWNSNKYTSL